MSENMWRKTSRSAEINCIEVVGGFIGDEPGVRIRDGMDPDSPALFFTKDEWLAFLRGAQAGEFDDLCP